MVTGRRYDADFRSNKLRNMTILGGMCCLVPLFAGSLAAASVCDDINDIADGWNEMAEGIYQLDIDALTMAEAEAIDQSVNDAANTTYQFANDLIASGDSQSMEYGQHLSNDLDAVMQAPGLDELGHAIDLTVDTLDELVDICDARLNGQHVQSQSSGGQFVVQFVPPPTLDDPEITESYNALRSTLESAPIFVELADDIDSYIHLPHDIPVTFQACGQANAFYDPEPRAIVMCYELFYELAAALTQMGVPDQEIAEAVTDGGGFTLLHEMGHALVDILQLPVTGREEDSVDALATVLLLDVDDVDPVLSALGTFKAWELASEGKAGMVWGEHSLSGQRYYDILCMLYGSDPDRFQGVVNDGLLPEERAVRCPAEWEQKATSWDVILEPHLAY